MAPGGTARIAVEVRDWRGQPVPGAEVTLLGVDEAVLQAAAYCDPDPLAAIYPPARPAGWELDSSHWFLQDQPPALRRLGTLGGPESVCFCSGTGASSPAITLREDLRPLAFFHPALTTDERGRIELEADRACVVRGRVLDTDGQPLAALFLGMESRVVWLDLLGLADLGRRPRAGWRTPS